MKQHKRQLNGNVLLKTIIWSSFAILAAVVIGHFAEAEGTLLKVNEKTVYAGDYIELASLFSEEQEVEEVAYELEEGNGEAETVKVSQEGVVEAQKAGTAQIAVTYKLPESIISMKEIFTVHVLAPQGISAVYGEQLPLLEAWKYYQAEEYEVILSEDSLCMREDKICVQGLKKAAVSLKKKESSREAFQVAEVEITAPVLTNEKFARAVGTDAFAPEISYFLQPVPDKIYQQDILEEGKIQWKIGNDTENQQPDEKGDEQVKDDEVSDGKQDGQVKDEAGDEKQDGQVTDETGDEKQDGQVKDEACDEKQDGQVKDEAGDEKQDGQVTDETGDGKQDDQNQEDKPGEGQDNGEQQAPSDETDKDAIAKVTEQGILALKVGKVSVSAVLTAKNGDTVTITGELIVTNPVLKTTQLVIAKGLTVSLVVDGTCEVSTYVPAKDEAEAVKDPAYISGGLNVYARAKGIADVSVIVDGKTMTAKVIVSNPKFTSNSAIMYRTQTKTVKLTGLNSTYSKVTFSSSNKKVATVTQKGVVKAKKSGRVRIYAAVDGKKIYVLVEVSSKAGYQAANKAIAVSKTKTKYSQLRRMSKGYYDCSSLVSRIYRPYGVYFGVKKGWSPTAASIGKWCTNNKKVLAKKAVSYTKLLPGDLICYSYTRNGRYRNISHIEIYVGNGKNVSASSSNNRVIHYEYKNGSTVLVARPKK